MAKQEELVPVDAIEAALIQGDLSRLTPEQRVTYYKATCESVGLNPLTKPFEYTTLNGKLILYAKKDCTDQLRKIHHVSIYNLEKEMTNGLYIVTAYASAGSRKDVATGVVDCANSKGQNLANDMMKAETKAKRRVTLSICGLGLLDETEVEDAASMPTEIEVIAEEPKALLQKKAAEVVDEPDDENDNVQGARSVAIKMREMGYGTANRDDALAAISYIVNRNVKSRKELTADEVKALMPVLHKINVQAGEMGSAVIEFAMEHGLPLDTPEQASHALLQFLPEEG